MDLKKIILSVPKILFKLFKKHHENLLANGPKTLCNLLNLIRALLFSVYKLVYIVS